jgi:hypothetical protein
LIGNGRETENTPIREDGLGPAAPIASPPASCHSRASSY